MDLVKLRADITRLLGLAEACQALDDDLDGEHVGAVFSLHETMRRELSALYDSLNDIEDAIRKGMTNG